MHLNCHTYFSFKFGTLSPEGLLKEASSKGVQQLVLTDINNTSAVLDFCRLALSNYNIKPVAGIDFRNGMDQQFIGIAKNHEGFHELNAFLSQCLHEGQTGLTGREAVIPSRAPGLENAFVIYPFSSLQAAQQQGKSADTGECLSSITDAGHLRENEFIGIRPSDLNRLRFSYWKNHTEKLVILAPVTFLNRTGFNVHRLLRAIDNNTLLSKLPLSGQASGDEIMITAAELKNIFSGYQRILQNTEKLLDECTAINFEFGESKNKKFFTKSIEDDRTRLLQLCSEGMSYRYPKSTDDVKKRFEKEIDLISQKEFTSYFLINHDIVSYARRKNYFYVGRGSGANSMVAYLLHITDVDPIELDLYFERFINPSRKNPPDFDIDFSWNDRDDVIDYIFYHSPYGKNYRDCVSLLATYSEMKDNSVMRELGKVFGLPKAEIDSLIDNRIHPGTPDQISRLISQYGKLLYSFPSHLGIHAGGILISENPITYYTALSNPPKGFPVTQFSMQEAEDVGFAKYDILSQRGLGKIKDAIEIIKENRMEDIDIHDVNRFKNDEQVKHHLQQAKLMGCFYVESPAMRMLLTKLKACTYLDLVAASSIIRPGVAQSGMMQEYIRRFHDPSRREYAHPLMKDLMEETFGIMVYQEDVIKVAHYFGKLSLEEADKLRRGMGGKYKGRQEFLEVKEKFFSNCRAEGYDERLIHDVWFQMETFGGYAFAKGHSASYAVESYQCMFLKVYYPLEFMVAVMNNGGGFFRVEYYIHEARMMGGIIHSPSINNSDALTTISGKDIYLGFGLMKELEVKTIEAIVKERMGYGNFFSLADFMRRISVSVDQLRILIRIGAFRFTGRTKQQLMWDVHAIVGSRKKSTARKELFDAGYKNFTLPELHHDAFADARDEMEILEFPLSPPFDLISQPLQNNLLAADLKKYTGQVIEIIGYYVTYKPTTTKKGAFMMFGCFIDRQGYFFDTNHFPEATKRFPFRGKGCYLVKGKVAEEFGFYSVNVMEMHKLDYLMYEDDAEAIARSKPDPAVNPVIVAASKQYKYRLVISPPPHIRREVERYKKKFHRQFDHPQAVHSKPHIILCDLTDTEASEQGIIRQVAAVVEKHPPFKISLENFDSLSSHAIVIHIINPDPVVEIAAELKKVMGLSSKSSSFTIDPFMAIAKGLDKEKFARATAEFCKEEYKASFITTELSLLRKDITVKYARYEPVKSFMLEGKPVNNSSLKPATRLNKHTVAQESGPELHPAN